MTGLALTFRDQVSPFEQHEPAPAIETGGASLITRLNNPHDLLSLAGSHLGNSSWHEVTQQRIDLFAEATGDHQWIHVDPERAKTGPFGTTIAHGYLTVSLAPILLAEVVQIADVTAVLNYGINRVRFPAPVPVGSSVRAAVTLNGAHERSAGTIEAAFHLGYVIDGSSRPPCTAELVYLYQ
jgi:acyl dehydratase